MRDLDETDLEILRLLAADARRPYSEIGDAVGLSGPAVSDRVDRLQEAGVIKQFTVAIDRSQLRAGVSVMIQFDLSAADLSRVQDRVQERPAVEHVFVTADGHLWCYARLDERTVREWIETVTRDCEAPVSYQVTLVDDVAWTPSVDGLEFGLTCAECSNTVDSEGETARIDGELYHFCCPSCLTRFKERYHSLEADT